MTESETYRARAAAEREAADITNLPRRREQHLRSAEAWEGMAMRLEFTAEKALINAKAKTDAQSAREQPIE